MGKNIRVENGPARKTAVATKTLLDDKVTASHYKVGERDAMGKPIVLGQTMTFLDYLGDWVWYIYKLGAERWEPAGVEATKELALQHAQALED